MSDRFNVKISGSTAMAVGSGASAKGKVSVGVNEDEKPTAVRVEVEARAATHADLAAQLEKVAAALRKGEYTGAEGAVGGQLTVGYAFNVERDGWL
jgi:hypothetical protein